MRSSYRSDQSVTGAAPTPGGPQPNVNLTFPCLNLKELSEEDRQALRDRLYSESVTIMSKFQSLFSATTESLKKRDISIAEVLCHLVGMGSLKPTFQDEELPSLRSKLKNAKTIDAVMLCVGDYCSFFNFQLLECIIEKVGTEVDKSNLAQYREEFRVYAQRHVFECPSEVGTMSEEGHANMFVKLDDTYENCTVGNLLVLVGKLRDLLQASLISGLKLCRFEPGCLKLTFQLPYSMLQEIFPLFDQQESALSRLGVEKLWLIYQFNRQNFTSVDDEESATGE